MNNEEIGKVAKQYLNKKFVVVDYDCKFVKDILDAHISGAESRQPEINVLTTTNKAHCEQIEVQLEMINQLKKDKAELIEALWFASDDILNLIKQINDNFDHVSDKALIERVRERQELLTRMKEKK